MLESPTTSAWHGILKLNYGRRENITYPLEIYAQSPYKFQRSYYPEDQDICYSTILHTAGGMVGGDRLSQSIQMQPHTHAVITTAAASKIYRSNGLITQQEIDIEVGESACLEYLPRETIVFAGAKYQQQLRVNLAPTATYLGWDIVRFGRSARGETFIEGDWRSKTEVRQDGRLLWVDRPWLPGGEKVWNSPHGLGGCPLVGTLAWLGKPVTPELITQVRELWTGTETMGEAGTTELISGLLCRYRGHDREEVINWFTKVWQLLRQWDNKAVAITPRVWRV